MATDKQWAKAQAEYRLGASLASLCKAHGLNMRELLKRIADEHWLRAGEVPKQQLALPGEAKDRITEAIDEAVADIIKDHRSISRELRTNLDDEIAEYQEIKQYFVSAMDSEAIRILVDSVPQGEPNPGLVQHLQDCLAAFGKRVQSLDKLVRLATMLITNERTVWGIDSKSEDGQSESYDDLLELCQAPVGPRVLPPNVTDFEAKLRQRKL